jgi:ComF family protein
MLQSFRRAFIDFFFPPLCLVCKRPLASYEKTFLCDSCTDELAFIDSPLCCSCGILFTSRAGDDHLCGNCRESPPRFDRARAAAVYAGAIRSAIHQFKYRGGLLFAKHLGQLLAEHGRRFFTVAEVDLIVPVPLHRRRLRQRGYNQSLELARHVGACWGMPVAPAWLLRNRETPQQTALSRQERFRNVRGAFAWTGPGLGDKRVVLIDDVYTSGATANECAGVLKKSGAGTVEVLTLAHTL